MWIASGFRRRADTLPGSIATVLLMLAGAPKPADAVPSISGTLNIRQVSWSMDATGSVPNSEYGFLSFNFNADPSLYFCNIVARRGAGGSDAWIVENLPLLRTSDLGTSSSSTCQTVDLSGMGVMRGTNYSGQTIFYTASFSTTPVASQPTNTLASSSTLGQQDYSYGGDIGAVAATPGLDVPAPPLKPAWNGDPSFELIMHRPVPNQEQGTNWCGPAAITNSLHWLAATYPQSVNLGGQTWFQTLQKMKTYTNWAPSGIGQKDAIQGKLRFAQDPGKSFNQYLKVKYEADAGLTDLGDYVQVGNQLALRNGNGGAPTFDYLLQQMRDGEDVELSIDWLSNAGVKEGGHVVTVVGVLRFGNKLYLWTNDDADQGDKQPDGTAPANLGLRTNMLHQVTIENGGHMRLTGFKVNNRVKATYVESVVPPGRPPMPGITGWTLATLALLLLGLGSLQLAGGRDADARRGEGPLGA